MYLSCYYLWIFVGVFSLPCSRCVLFLLELWVLHWCIFFVILCIFVSTRSLFSPSCFGFGIALLPPLVKMPILWLTICLASPSGLALSVKRSMSALSAGVFSLLTFHLRLVFVALCATLFYLSPNDRLEYISRPFQFPTLLELELLLVLFPCIPVARRLV